MWTGSKHPRRREQQERHKFAYLTIQNFTFARFARAFFIFEQLRGRREQMMTNVQCFLLSEALVPIEFQDT